MFSTITDTVQAFTEKKASPADLLKQNNKAIKAWNPHINSLLEVFESESKDQAENPAAGPLSGIPIAIKDNICTTEGHTRAASRMLEHYQSPYDATVVKRLRSAGAIIIGKANCDEFAMGSSTEYSAYGPVKNPWDVSRVPGGSSGGSAAAVASGQVLAALGTDTGGSIRHPSSFCSTVGLRPTYGRVSRFGVVAYGSSLDQVGPITRTVKDSARLLSVLAGSDPLDATASDEAVPDYEAACGQGVEGLVIGMPKEFFGDGIDKKIAAVVREAIKSLEGQGAIIKEISLPLTSAAIPVYYLIAKSEASTNLARFDALRYGKMDLASDDLISRYMEARGQGFGPEVKRAILMGTYALSAGYYDAWYKQASKVRTLITQEYEQAFTEVDLIAGPTTGETAFKLGSKTDDPLQMYLTDSLVVPASVAGLPAISIPCGFASSEPNGQGKQSANLPVGLQLIAPSFQEERLFQAGHAYEQAHDWHKQTPKIPA